MIKPCRDRCFTRWTIGKWVLTAALFGTTIYFVQEFESRTIEVLLPDGTSVDFNNNASTSGLDILLILFVLQHPLFMLARVPIFMLFAIITFCCDKGTEYPAEEDFKDCIISYDFVHYELGILNNFRNHPTGRNELEYYRSLRFSRRQTQQERQQNQAENQDLQLGASFFKRQASRMGSTIQEMFAADLLKELICPICISPMEAGDKVIQLPCHPTHQIHIDCFTRWYDYNVGRDLAHLNLCPACRVPIKVEECKKVNLLVRK